MYKRTKIKSILQMFYERPAVASKPQGVRGPLPALDLVINDPFIILLCSCTHFKIITLLLLPTNIIDEVQIGSLRRKMNWTKWRWAWGDMCLRGRVSFRHNSTCSVVSWEWNLGYSELQQRRFDSCTEMRDEKCKRDSGVLKCIFRSFAFLNDAKWTHNFRTCIFSWQFVHNWSLLQQVRAWHWFSCQRMLHLGSRD